SSSSIPTPTPAPMSISSTSPRSMPMPPPASTPVPMPMATPRTIAPGERIEMHDSARRIGAQVDIKKGFLPFDQIERSPQQLRMDYEALRMIYELSRAIGLVHDLDKLMRKV